MVHWSDSDCGLLKRLNQESPDKTLDQLTDDFNNQAECNMRTPIAVASKIKRMDVLPKRPYYDSGTRPRKSRATNKSSDQSQVDELEDDSDLQDEDQDGTDKEIVSISSSDDDDELNATVDSPNTSAHRASSTTATRKRPRSPSLDHLTPGPDQPDHAAGSDIENNLIQDLESHLKYSGMMIELKKRRLDKRGTEA